MHSCSLDTESTLFHVFAHSGLVLIKMFKNKVIAKHLCSNKAWLMGGKMYLETYTKMKYDVLFTIISFLPGKCLVFCFCYGNNIRCYL
mmetsp:Transcript_31227/g.46564  ORF Transcript_31227/g.46564 Transcript_31227/m.46564 type:complete len:88 (+) Transcript_31227:119-382(+)